MVLQLGQARGRRGGSQGQERGDGSTAVCVVSVFHRLAAEWNFANRVDKRTATAAPAKRWLTGDLRRSEPTPCTELERDCGGWSGQHLHQRRRNGCESRLGDHRTCHSEWLCSSGSRWPCLSEWHGGDAQQQNPHR